MKKLLATFSLLAALGWALLSCQKEIGFDVTGGSGTTGVYGWSFTGGGNSYHGCFDTAFYSTVSGQRLLSLRGTDSSGNSIIATLLSSNPNFAAGTYNAPQNATFALTLQNGTPYTGTSANSFTVQVNTINDTLIDASFTGNLSSVITGQSLPVTQGHIRALIGKHNPCGSFVLAGPGTASFTLGSTGGNCSANIQGTYLRSVALSSSNKVQMDVNVTTPGTWNLSTSTINGMKFSGTGNFTSTGAQTVSLQGSGTPSTYGPNQFPVQAVSSACGFSVPVDTILTAPCNPIGNTATLSGVVNMSFNYVGHISSNNTYIITGNGGEGEIRLEFAGLAQPTPGRYNIQTTTGNFSNGDVRVSFIAQNIYWQSYQGSVYISVANTHATAIFCSIGFSGTIGGPTLTTTASAKVTEEN